MLSEMESMAIDFEEENKFKRILATRICKEAAQKVLKTMR